MGLLIVFGLLFAALNALYRFIVENLAPVPAICAISGGVPLAAYLFSRIKARARNATTASSTHDTLRVPIDRTIKAEKSPPTAPPAAPARWVLERDGLPSLRDTIAAGRFYLGEALYFQGTPIDSYVVNPKLLARASRPDVAGDSMPY